MSLNNSFSMPSNSDPLVEPPNTTTTVHNPVSDTTPDPSFRTDTDNMSTHASDEEEDDHNVVFEEVQENMEAMSITTSRNDRIAALLDQMIKATMSGKRPSEGVPELVFMLACPMHGPDPGLGKGLFKLADKGLGKMSVSQLLTHVEALVRDAEAGCGVVGCQVTLEDAILESCEEDIICFRCPDKSLVNPQKACILHDDTNHLNLVMVALAEVTKWYADKARKVMFKGTPLRFTDAFGHQILPVVITQALHLHHYVKSNSLDILNELASDPLGSQFSLVISLLTDHQKGAGQPAAK